MGLFRKRDAATPKSVTAAALPLEGPSRLQVGRALRDLAKNEDWQKEAWYYFDAVGEFRAALTWIANAISKAELYAAELDPETGQPGDPVDDARVQAVAQAVLGGAEQRPQHLKTMALQWQCVGESFVIARPQGAGKPDAWMTLSSSRVTYKGGSWSFLDPHSLQNITLTGRDLLIRVWEPHPDDPLRADAASRPALPILREIEKTSQYIGATLDSRLKGAGIWLVPSEMSFPSVEGLERGEALMDLLMNAMAASLKNPGTAESQVPLTVEVPGELIAAAKDGFIDFATAFDAAVVELRQDALRRLAGTLDMPNETAEGSTGGMNHWGAWQVEESTYKIFVQPALDRIGDALTEYYFRPALTAAGVANPERYTLAWNVAGIVSRPDRTGELKELWDDGLISDDYRLAQLGVPEDAQPTEDEANLRRLERVVMGAPTLAADPEISSRLFGFEIAPAAAGVDPVAIEGADAVQEQQQNALPAAPDAEARPDDALVAAASVVTLRALERAGGKLLTREHRGQFANVPKWELHTHIRPEDPGALAAEVCSEEFIRAVDGNHLVDLLPSLRLYVIDRLYHGLPHDVERLRTLL